MDQLYVTKFSHLDAAMKKRFAYASANFYQVTGIRGFEEELALFGKLEHFSSWRSKIHPEVACQTYALDNQALKPYLKAPQFWVSFHFGIYQFLPFRLLMQGASVCLVISRRVVEQFVEYYRKAAEKYQPSGKLCFLEAEDPKLFFKLRQKVHLSFHPFVFADGNSGAIQADQLSCASVRLSNAVLDVRQGYLRIAALLKLPVNLLLEESTENELVSLRAERLADMVLDDKQSLLEDLYHRFWNALEGNLHLWEAWYYLHHQLSLPVDSIDQAPCDRFIPFPTTSGYQALNQRTYQLFHLSENEYHEIINQLCSV